MPNLQLTPILTSGYEVKINGGTVKLGEFICGDDGFYIFFPEEGGGAWTAWLLHLIATSLDTLNAPWQNIIDNDPLLKEAQDAGSRTE